MLIDYKGGGLAGAFENRKTGIKLPHLVGTITNLDKSEMNRTLVSIKSELQRRQRMFNEAKEKLDTGNIDIYKELLKGSYSIFKDDEYKIEREENNLYAKDIEILEKNIPIVIGLYKFYDCDTIKDIFEYCVEKKQNRINYRKLNRIRKFVQIESNRKRK